MAQRTGLALSGRISAAIIVVRGQRAILDADLAALDGVDTKALNQAVRRNLERFPPDFLLRLSAREANILRSQTVTSSQHGGRRTRPFAFTEQGIAMLSSVLRSRRAVAVNIEIMRVFVSMRRFIDSHADIAERIDSLEEKYDGQFTIVFRAIREIIAPAARPRRRIGFQQFAALGRIPAWSASENPSPGRIRRGR